jgi:hypothetical protein
MTAALMSSAPSTSSDVGTRRPETRTTGGAPVTSSSHSLISPDAEARIRSSGGSLALGRSLRGNEVQLGGKMIEVVVEVAHGGKL